MIKLTAFFDEHHLGSAQSIARILADQWPVMTVRVENGAEQREYSQGNPSLNNAVTHSCQHCHLAILDAIRGPIYPNSGPDYGSDPGA